MIELLRELFHYQAWADSQIVAAVKSHPGAAGDEQLRTLLHHIVVVQRFFIGQCAGETFDVRRESRIPETIEEMEGLFDEAHGMENEVLATLDDGALAVLLDRPPLEKLRPTIRTALTQAVLHCQHHRAQVATRLRALGGSPPTVDYILWKKDRP
jgi:uncharacterized damage-inducible protein DinB